MPLGPTHMGARVWGDVAYLGSACISDAGALPHPLHALRSFITSRQSLR